MVILASQFMLFFNETALEVCADMVLWKFTKMFVIEFELKELCQRSFSLLFRFPSFLFGERDFLKEKELRLYHILCSTTSVIDFSERRFQGLN